MMKLHYGLLPIRDTQDGSETVFSGKWNYCVDPGLNLK